MGLKTVCFIPARLGSERFPGKVLAPLLGKPLIQHVVERCCQALMVDEVVVCIPDNKDNKRLATWLREHKCRMFSPPGIAEDDLLGRLTAAADEYNPETIVRVNGDSPLIVPDLIDRAIKEMRSSIDVDYVGYCFNGKPSVLTKYAAPELFTVDTLRLWNASREHVTVGAYQEIVSHWLDMGGRPYKTVVDTQKDLRDVTERLRKMEAAQWN